MGARKGKRADHSPNSPPGLIGTFWRLALVGTLLFALAGTGGYFAMRHLLQQTEVQAPDLLALDLRQAVVHASQLGFSTRIVDEESSEVLEAGHVLAQRPSPGTWAKPGSTIVLTVSK